MVNEARLILVTEMIKDLESKKNEIEEHRLTDFVRTLKASDLSPLNLVDISTLGQLNVEISKLKSEQKLYQLQKTLLRG